MKSLKRIAELAEKFEHKLSKYAQQSRPQVDEGGNPQVIRDAFFGSSTGAGGKSQEGFSGGPVTPGGPAQGFIYREGSAFQKVIQRLPATAKLNVGVMIDVPRGKAEFTDTLPSVKTALMTDYGAYFGKTPIERVKEKIAGGVVSPNLVGKASGVIVL